MLDVSIKKEKIKFVRTLIISVVAALLLFILSLMSGRYGFTNPVSLFKMFFNLFGAKLSVSKTETSVVTFIRLPRTIAAFLIGASLAVSGLVYQNTFKNKLVSPDILGVSAGCCVGAGIAILIGISGLGVSLCAFGFGIAAVFITLLFPKLFKNKSTIILVLSGIIVGAFMNSIIALLKFLADKSNKLSEITFWMMGSVAGVTMTDILYVLPCIAACFVVLMIMSMRIDVVSLGKEEATSLGVKYTANRLIIVLCSTLLTAASVSISGNVGWVGLVIPHIARSLSGWSTKRSLPVTFILGGAFMIAVDMLSRLLSVDEIPLSIITGLLGGLIYTVILIKMGRKIND